MESATGTMNVEPAAPEPEDAARAWTLWDVTLSAITGLVFGVVLAAVAAVVLGVLFEDLSEVILFATFSVLIYTGTALAIYLLVLKRRRVSWADLGCVGAPGSAFPKMFLLSIGVLVMNGIVVAILSSFLGDVPTAEDQLLGDGRNVLSVAELMGLLATGAVAAPIVEELVFRGLLYRRLKLIWNRRAALVVSALAFAAVHAIVPLMPSLFMMGVIFALVADRYNSLYPAMALHAFNNGIVILLLYATLNG